MEIDMMTMEMLESGFLAYGTPLYIFDLDASGRTIKDVKHKTEGTADICYAMKANPFLAKQMAGDADRLEVCSMGEYEICRALNISPQKLLISGVLKEEAELDKILSECGNVCTYTVESLNQYFYFADWCRKNRQSLQIYLRLSSGNQFGMDEETVKDLVLVRGSNPLLEIKGLHFFSGTRKRSVEVIKKELSFLDQFLITMEQKHDFSFRTLEYGPGLNVPYFTDQEKKGDEELLILNEAIRSMKWKGRVVLEMGRFLAAMGGYYATTVRDLKSIGGTNYCIVDGGMHQFGYDGQLQGMYQPYMQVCPQKEYGELKEWTICGALCTNNDVLVRNVSLRELRVGDVLIFHRAGAYAVTEGMSLFLSRSLPGVAVYSSKDGWHLVRDRQTTYQWNMERSWIRESQ